MKNGRIISELQRCAEEQIEMMAQTKTPAWLVTLGVEDWEMEKRLIKVGPQ